MLTTKWNGIARDSSRWVVCTHGASLQVEGLDALAMDPADFYGVRGAGFTSLRRELGWLPGEPHPREESLTRAIGASLLRLDDPDRLRATAQLCGTGKRWRPLPDALALLWQASAWRDELRQLLHLLAERTERRLHPLPWALPVPLRVHGRYSRAEIEAAFGILTGDAPWIHREGVLWHEPSQCDLLFVTLNKSESLFSPTTRYRDLALGPALFHWESQSTTTAASPTGQRYIHHEARGSRVLLYFFAEACGDVREHRREGGRAGGVTEPFRCLGFARYVSHEGERPMAIRWRLERAIPAAWMQGMGLAV